MELLRISSKAMFPTTMGLTMESSWDARRVVELLAGAENKVTSGTYLTKKMKQGRDTVRPSQSLILTMLAPEDLEACV